MGETNMMTTAQPIESVSDAPAKVPVPCAFPSPNVAHQALASVPLPAAVPQDYRQSVCMPHPAPHASEAKSESPARKVEDESEDEYVTSDRGFEDEDSEEDSVEFQGLV